MRLIVGSKVMWMSQSGGFYKEKRGVIHAVVPRGGDPSIYGYRPNGGPAGMPRDHESYLVLVGNRLYWPRVSQLKEVHHDEEVRDC